MNSTNNTTVYQIKIFPILIGYFNVFIIVSGILGNTISFIVFRFHKSFKTMPSMVFLSFVAITDTLDLFEWNLSHFVELVFAKDLQQITGCRLLIFAQYSSIQSSALLLSAMCIDRYVTVTTMPGSFLRRLPFRTVRHAFVWSSAIVFFCVLLNFHLLFTTGKNNII